MSMKFNKLRVTLLLMMGCFWSLLALSQTHYRSNVSVGAKAGADLSKVFFNPSVKQSLYPGFLAGIHFRYIEETHFGLLAELNFVQRGWKENFEESPYFYSRRLNYLMVPVLAHIYFGHRGKFFFNVGPEIGFRISDTYKSNFDISQTATLPDFNKYHNIQQYTEPIKQRVDYGIAAGLGGEFSINPKNAISAEVRFYYGLGNLFSSSRKDYFNASNSMNLEFTLGYWLRIK